MRVMAAVYTLFGRSQSNFSKAISEGAVINVKVVPRNLLFFSLFPEMWDDSSEGAEPQISRERPAGIKTGPGTRKWEHVSQTQLKAEARFSHFFSLLLFLRLCQRELIYCITERRGEGGWT